MTYRKHKQGERWDYKKVDQGALLKEINTIVFHCNRLAWGAERGSILIDLDYGEMFDAMERVYGIAMIGDLAADNADRQKAHNEMLKRKGLTNSD